MTKIKLPPEFISANDVPVERATIKRERMIEIISAAIEADRKARFNLEAELVKARCEGYALGVLQTSNDPHIRANCEPVGQVVDWDGIEWAKKSPPICTYIFTAPQPQQQAGEPVETMTASELADRVSRGEKWQVSETGSAQAKERGDIIGWLRHRANWSTVCIHGAMAGQIADHIQGLEKIIAACRDAMPIPPAGSEAEKVWPDAMSDISGVVPYIQESVKAMQARGEPVAYVPLSLHDGKPLWDSVVEAGSALYEQYKDKCAWKPLYDKPQPQQIPEGYRLQPISEFDAMMDTRTIPEGYKLVPDFKVGMRVKFKGMEYKIFAKGDKPGTFDICLPNGVSGDRWLNVPPDALEILKSAPEVKV